MANEKRLTEKHYDGKGYYLKCSEECHLVDLSCEDCVVMQKLVDRLGEYEDKAEQTVEVPDKDLLKAIKLLIKQYGHSKASEYVHSPVAHALFHTWKQLDESGYGKRRTNHE